MIKLSTKKITNTATAAVILCATLFLLFFIATTISNDIEEYFVVIEMMNGVSFLESFITLRYEIGSLFLLWFFSQLFSNFTTFYLIGAIAVYTKYMIFLRYLTVPNLAFLIYAITFLHIVDGNQIRAAIAISIMFYALFKEPTSKFFYLVWASAAILFHYSGILILFLYFRKRPLFLAFIIAIIGLMFDLVISSIGLLSFASIWKSSGVGAVNLTNSLFLAQTFISCICIYYWRFLDNRQQRGALLCLAGVTVYLFFLNNPIVAHRVRELCQLGIFAIVFSGGRRRTIVKQAGSLTLGYMAAYNVYRIVSEVL